MSQADDQVLWLQYVDWSATQINRRLLELTADQLWDIAHAEPGRLVPGSSEIPPALLPPPDSPPYLELVRSATLSIAKDLHLPAFPAWKEAYLLDPEPFLRDISGIQAGDGTGD